MDNASLQQKAFEVLSSALRGNPNSSTQGVIPMDHCIQVWWNDEAGKMWAVDVYRTDFHPFGL